jgi:hypothetical protein
VPAFAPLSEEKQTSGERVENGAIDPGRTFVALLVISKTALHKAI